MVLSKVHIHTTVILQLAMTLAVHGVDVADDVQSDPCVAVTTSAATCHVCLDDSTSIVTALCSPTCPAYVCKACIERYLVVQSKSTPAGVLATVACPICLRPVAMARWREVCSAKSVSTLEHKVAASCEVLCPSCHHIQSALPAYAPVIIGGDWGLLSDEQRTAVVQFCNYEVSIADLWHAVRTVRGDVLLEYLSRHVQDVERRASIFLCVMRRDPFIALSCCGALVCFTCKTRGHHHGQACEAIDLDNDIAQCPNCSLTLVKGDGCDAVVCYCKFEFFWTDAAAAFRFKLVSDRAKRCLQHAFVRYVYRRRFRAKVLVAMVALIQIKAHKRPLQAVSSFLRMRAWRRRLAGAFNECLAAATLWAIRRHRKSWLHACEYLRSLVWRRRFQTRVLTSPAMAAAIAHRRQVHCVNEVQNHIAPMAKTCEYLRRQVWRRKYSQVLWSRAFHDRISARRLAHVRCSLDTTRWIQETMRALSKRMVQSMYRNHMDRVLVALVAKLSWASHWSPMSVEKRALVDDEMEHFLAIGL